MGAAPRNQTFLIGAALIDVESSQAAAEENRLSFSVTGPFKMAADNVYRTYQLTIHLRRSTTLAVGRLGSFQFPSGTYMYTGSGKRNMEARIRRHLAGEKRARWHIDYLLLQPDARVVRIERFREAECEVNQRTKGRIVADGFGASDCRNGCRSHLKLAR